MNKILWNRVLDLVGISTRRAVALEMEKLKPELSWDFVLPPQRLQPIVAAATTSRFLQRRLGVVESGSLERVIPRLNLSEA